jgi:ADP-heptose:LPS heptosyltransferase
MGDIVLCSPVVRCLKKAYPESEIHFLTKPGFASIVKANPHIHKVWEWDEHNKNTLSELATLKFDFIVDLHHNLRSLKVKLALKRPSSAFKKLNIEKYLKVRFKINSLPKKHIVERYLDTLKKLNVFDDELGLDFFIPSGEEIAISTLPAAFQNGYVVLVAGALKATKQLPEAKLIELCAKLKQPIIILGGKAEEELGKNISGNFENRVLNYCGKLSLSGSASLIKQAKCVISHDTGLMHIAAAFKKPIISIWGNTIPDFGMYPYFPQNDVFEYRSEVKGLPCRPCSKIGYSSCPKGHFKCMMNQDLEEIKRAVDSVCKS